MHVVDFEDLYDELTNAFPHPFDWMGLLEKPPWWMFRHRKAYRKVSEIFASHGLLLSRRVAIRFISAESQRWDEDAGGVIIRKLRYACDGLVADVPEESVQ